MTTECIDIREACPDDIPRIASVLHESFLEYRSRYTREAFELTTPTSRRLFTRMREGPIWVGLQDNRIVSTLSAVHRNEELYLRGMAVLPKSRGKRIGWLLLEYAERYALKHGSKRLLLSTTPFLTRAITLYEQFGFQRTDEGPYDLSGTPIYTMEKRLSNHEPSGDQGTHNYC